MSITGTIAAAITFYFTDDPSLAAQAYAVGPGIGEPLEIVGVVGEDA